MRNFGARCQRPPLLPLLSPGRVNDVSGVRLRAPTSQLGPLAVATRPHMPLVTAGLYVTAHRRDSRRRRSPTCPFKPNHMPPRSPLIQDLLHRSPQIPSIGSADSVAVPFLVRFQSRSGPPSFTCLHSDRLILPLRSSLHPPP